MKKQMKYSEALYFAKHASKEGYDGEAFLEGIEAAGSINNAIEYSPYKSLDYQMGVICRHIFEGTVSSTEYQKQDAFAGMVRILFSIMF